MVDMKAIPNNLTFVTSNSEIYFLQKKMQKKNSDVLINITNDQVNQKLKLDVDYDNNTQVIIDSKKIIIDNTTNTNSQQNDGFLKQKLQTQGNKIVRDSVVDCSNSNNTSSVQAVCSLCNVNHMNIILFIFAFLIIYIV